MVLGWATTPGFWTTSTPHPSNQAGAYDSTESFPPSADSAAEPGDLADDRSDVIAALSMPSTTTTTQIAAEALALTAPADVEEEPRDGAADEAKTIAPQEGSGTGSMPSGQEAPGSSVTESWTVLAEGQAFGPWSVVYDGYGEVSASTPGGTMQLEPARADGPDETHAALVLSAREYSDVELHARITTVEQLRHGTANPWECGWLVWSYSENTAFYYLAIKTNGWELGKADPDYPGAQRFLVDQRNSGYRVGVAVDVVVQQVGPRLKVWIEGELVAEYTDEEAPYLSGRIGLYSEDASVLFEEVSVTSPY